MIGSMKRQIRLWLENKYDGRYRRLWQEKTISYHSWISKQEENRKADSAFSPGKTAEEGVAFYSLEDLEKEGQPWLRGKEEIVCFVEKKGWIRKGAAALLLSCFETNPQVQVVYGDEDEANSKGDSRMNPWFKPDYSPDTLLSWFYFGSLVAFRRDSLKEISFAKGMTPRQKLYAITLQVCLPLERGQVYHLKEMLMTVANIRYWGFQQEYASLREKASSLCPKEEVKGVSIIIPSKDNPKVLKQCLTSIRAFSRGLDYELIIVDNGSSEKNRKEIEGLQEVYGFTYLYQPMKFNFSRMCNLGAQKSSKDLLLFLNDDCEARQEGWLEALSQKAACRHVGAVGVKLYYPEGRKIQHCGVYSLYLGPVHKLQYKEDDRIYYDRRNRDTRNVLAVTAACLMVRKEVFHQAGGFDEKLEVAFNDVDFCWRLYEQGLSNVVLNETFLWHHESLSRGSDESPEKKLRLKGENERLYEKHRELWDQDPYYHEGFTHSILDLNYSCAYEYDGTVNTVLKPTRLKALPKKIREDRCVAPMLEFAGAAGEWFLDEKEKKGKDSLLYLQGHVMVLGADNACFEADILFLGEKGECYQIHPDRRYRPDVVVNVPDQKNVDLCGFVCLMETKELPWGIYEIAFLMKDKCSTQYLQRKTGWKLELPIRGKEKGRG